MKRGRWALPSAGVRAKFIVMLAVASAVPLAIGLISLQVLGHRYFIAEKGRLYHSIAEHLAETLDQGIYARIDHLQEWAVFSPLAEATRQTALSPMLPPATNTTPTAQIAAIEAQWPRLADSAPLVAFTLTNRVTHLIGTFRAFDPLYAELLVTDRYGRLVAASNKTTDYWQSDEEWWQRAVNAGPHVAWVDGIHFDDSAGVHSLDVATAIYQTTATGATELVAVVKGVLDVSPFLHSLRSARFPERPARMVVVDSGAIVTTLSGPNVAPFHERIAPDAVTQLRSRQHGSAVIQTPDGKRLMGFAAFDGRPARVDETVQGFGGMYVVVSDDMDYILHPFHRHLVHLSWVSVVVVVLCSLAGLVLANRGIITPIRILQDAAGSISARAHLSSDAPSSGSSAPETTPAVGQKDIRRAIDRLAAIRSGNEFGELAHDFRLMADRVLRYHEQLENELQARTEEVQGDLMVAREFQEALLPRKYPLVPEPRGADPVELGFHHVYRPALSVGGDFFDVVRLSPHRAGVFIADVMGHGARSALITAILRTLLQNVSVQEDSPAAVLSRMNNNFRGLLPDDLDIVFATAAYMVLDTRQCKAAYSLAGHHAPWFVRRSEGHVAPLPSSGTVHPAFGLLPDVTYEQSEHDFQPGDLFLLFTDGLTEAPDPQGDEFGEERLRRVIETNAQRDAAGLLEAILDALHDHMSTVISPDDICLVSVDILPAPKSTP